MIRYIITIAFIGICLTAQTQDLGEEINCFNAELLAQPYKHIKTSVWVFDSSISNREELAGNMELWQAGNQCHYKILELEVIQNEKYLIQIDHSERDVSVSPPSNADVILGQYSPQAVSQFLSMANNIKLITGKAGYNGYRMEFGPVDNGLEAVEMFFDKISGQLKETRYHYKFYDWVTETRSTYSLRMVYESYVFPKTISATKFDTENIIGVDEKGFMLQSAYKGYSLSVDESLANPHKTLP